MAPSVVRRARIDHTLRADPAEAGRTVTRRAGVLVSAYLVGATAKRSACTLVDVDAAERGVPLRAARAGTRGAGEARASARRPTAAASTGSRLTRRTARAAVGVREALAGAGARLGIAAEVGGALLRQAVRRKRFTAPGVAHQAGTTLASTSAAVALVGGEIDARVVALGRRSRAARAHRHRSATSRAARPPPSRASGHRESASPCPAADPTGRWSRPGVSPPCAHAHGARLIALTRRARLAGDPTRLAEGADLTALHRVTAARARGLARVAERGSTPGRQHQRKDEEENGGAQARHEGTAHRVLQGFDVHAR